MLLVKHESETYGWNVYHMWNGLMRVRCAIGKVKRWWCTSRGEMLNVCWKQLSLFNIGVRIILFITTCVSGLFPYSFQYYFQVCSCIVSTVTHYPFLSTLLDYFCVHFGFTFMHVLPLFAVTLAAIYVHIALSLSFALVLHFQPLFGTIFMHVSVPLPPPFWCPLHICLCTPTTAYVSISVKPTNDSTSVSCNIQAHEYWEIWPDTLHCAFYMWWDVVRQGHMDWIVSFRYEISPNMNMLVSTAPLDYNSCDSHSIGRILPGRDEAVWSLQVRWEPGLTGSRHLHGYTPGYWWSYPDPYPPYTHTHYVGMGISGGHVRVSCGLANPWVYPMGLGYLILKRKVWLLNLFF